MWQGVSVRRHPRPLIPLALVGLACCQGPVGPPPTDEVGPSGLRPEPVRDREGEARALFGALDECLADAWSESWARQPPASIGELLVVPTAVREQVAAEVETLARRGIACADELVAQHPDQAAGHHWAASHRARLAWAISSLQVLREGLPGAVLRSIDRAILLQPDYDHHAPLRLKGRFLAEAPWPIGDRDLARILLQRCVQQDPIQIHHLFLGDALFDQGQITAARAEWERVERAPAGDASPRQQEWLRECARRRLELTQPGADP